MPVSVSVGKREYYSTKSKHAEEIMFESGRYDSGDFEVEMDAWPCTGERHHDCHSLFIKKSSGRKITLIIKGDHGGYAACHGRSFGASGKIVYNNGVAEVE